MDSRQKAGEPFFAYIVTNAPHGPVIAPPKNRKRFTDLGFGEKQAGFYGMVENIDENLGLLLDKLAAWGLEENTLLIFLSDNGMTGGGSGRPGKPVSVTPDGTTYAFYNAGMKGLKGSVDEGGVRVPAFFSWKGHIAEGRVLKQLARHIDMFPTLAALAGAKLPEGQVEGRSLLPLLENPDADWPDRMFFIHRGRWPKGANPDKYQWKGFSVRSQRFLLVGKSELYDMQADPGQKKNIAEQHPEQVKEMLTAYGAWWKKTRPMMVNEKTPNSKSHPFPERYKKQLENGGIPDWQAPDLESP
jgi:arylsulfatase